MILKYAKKLQRAKWPKHQVGIQFVQVGDSKEAARALKEMDDGLKHKTKRVSPPPYPLRDFSKQIDPSVLIPVLQDMVDYTLYDPTAVSGSSEDEHTIQGQLTKILVGAIDSDVDRKTTGNINAKQGK